METEKTINELIKEFGLHNKARELAEMADWFRTENTPMLAEYCRYAHRTVCDFIDEARTECKTLDDMVELLDNMRYCSFNDYKYYQRECFAHFAELAMVRHQTLGEIASHIERNK